MLRCKSSNRLSLPIHKPDVILTYRTSYTALLPFPQAPQPLWQPPNCPLPRTRPPPLEIMGAALLHPARRPRRAFRHIPRQSRTLSPHPPKMSQPSLSLIPSPLPSAALFPFTPWRPHTPTSSPSHARHPPNERAELVEPLHTQQSRSHPRESRCTMPSSTPFQHLPPSQQPPQRNTSHLSSPLLRSADKPRPHSPARTFD